MSTNGRKERLDKEIEEMEKIASGQEVTPEETTGEEEPTPSADPVPPATNEDDLPKQETPQAEKRQYTNWKQRYTELRGHHDSLVYELRTEVAALKEQNLAVTKQYMKLKDEIQQLQSSQPEAPLFTDEERDILGQETIDAVTRATKQMTEKAINPLKEELESERSRRIKMEEREAEQAKASAYNIFLNRLAQLVPDYADINVDPGFLGWLDQQDSFSGYKRMDLFKRAEGNGDVARVAQFFTEFKAELSKHVDPHSRHVTPTGASSNPPHPTSNESEIISMAHVNKFYDDAARGRYKNNMSAFRNEEAKIEKAFAEGRVRK